MKMKLFAATAVLALGLAACGGETPAPEPVAEAPAAEAPAPEPAPVATASIGETPADQVAFMKTRPIRLRTPTRVPAAVVTIVEPRPGTPAG